jgi:hypothetical protein
MILQSLSGSSIDAFNERGGVFFCACGYERRSSALAQRLSPSVKWRTAVCFDEHPNAFARSENELVFKDQAFSLVTSDSVSLSFFERALEEAIATAIEKKVPLGIDISSMTRAWHGAIVRTIVRARLAEKLETHFLYVPGAFQPPPTKGAHNEIVGPVEGFSSLSAPDAPIALVLGLGYERERALGLNQLLDPGKTIILISHAELSEDLYFPEVVKSNQELIGSIPEDCRYDYPLDDPVATFGVLESICFGLERDYRAVIASLGPKLFGILSFLVATKNRNVSVWRVSSGIHGEPRDVLPDLSRAVGFRTVWVNGAN